MSHGDPCDCAETKYVDLQGIARRIFHPLHNCEYVRLRNALISGAYASAIRLDDRDLVRRIDVALFMRTMDESAKPLRQRRPPPPPSPPGGEKKT